MIFTIHCLVADQTFVAFNQELITLEIYGYFQASDWHPVTTVDLDRADAVRLRAPGVLVQEGWALTATGWTQ